MRKWHKRFLKLAQMVASWSKDPSTQVGCVIVDDNKKVVGLGYNGFPKGVHDTEKRLNDRETKYKYIVHAEPNAIANANSSIEGCTVYTFPFAPCHECMKMLATHGVKRVVFPPLPENLRERWSNQLEVARHIANETDIELVEIIDYDD